MSWIDTRTTEQKLNDNAWYAAGKRSERQAIINLLEDYLAKDTAFRNLEEVLDYIERGGHHE